MAQQLLRYCRHPRCIVDAAANLFFAAAVLPSRRAELSGLALDLARYDTPVRCAQVPRRGAVAAPFAGAGNG